VKLDETGVMVWEHNDKLVPAGSGLGTSAAWHMLHGRDVAAEESASGCGWQDEAVIKAGGLCTWQGGGDRPKLLHQSRGEFLQCRMLIWDTGKRHKTADVVGKKRDLHFITDSGEMAAHAIQFFFPDALIGWLRMAVANSYAAQRIEGMDPLPEVPGGYHKYLGAGWGGFALYLFRDPDRRNAWAAAHPEFMKVEPFNYVD
jgi:mevalonate kinase